MLTTTLPAPPRALPRTLPYPDIVALTPWEFGAARNEPRPARLRGAAPDAGAEIATAISTEIAALSARVAGLTGLDLVPADLADAVADVARHLRGARPDGTDATDTAVVARVRRVLASYDHHLAHHRFVLGPRATLADFLLWTAVIALPVRLGEPAAADALRGLDAVERWAGRLASGHRSAVTAAAQAEIDALTPRIDDAA